MALPEPWIWLRFALHVVEIERSLLVCMWYGRILRMEHLIEQDQDFVINH